MKINLIRTSALGLVSSSGRGKLFSKMASSESTAVSSVVPYVPPKVWVNDADSSSMNKPTAGYRFEKELPVGKHALQLYSFGTPNGQKVTIFLEELLELGKDAEYDAWPISIMKGDQFGSDFVSINPNSKIPAVRIYDKSGNAEPLNLFESGSILLQLAEKYGALIPTDPVKRSETLNWLFWQMGSAPFVGGGFGHFFAYAPEKQKYPIDRFTMETKRQLDVLDKQLAQRKFMVGDEYTIADIAIFTWYGQLVLGQSYANASEFLNADEEYPNVIRWAKEIDQRPAVQRGKIVNKVWGDKQLPERHDAKDFEQFNL
jgi:GSH-dependent disulfide-bond oxidoreductase